MTTLLYDGQLTRKDELGEPSGSAVKSSLGALLRLAVVLASALAGGIAAHRLLGDPGIQATVINAATGAAGAVVAMFTAYLFVRRMHRTFAVGDVLLGAMLTLLPAVSAIAALMPVLQRAADREAAQFVAATAAGVVASLGLVAAAATRQRLLASTKQTDRLYVGTLVSSAIVLAGAALLTDWASTALDPEGRPTVLTVIHVTAGFGAGAAAVSFFRASTAGDDPVLAWLAAAAAIVAAAHVTDALLPWTAGDLTSGGNLVQVAGWLALLVGGIRDFDWAHRRAAENAVFHERRRLARELHDGLAQELAFITTESRRLSAHPGAQHLAEAAERALEESRAAILALTRPTDEPLERTIAVAAQSVGARAGLEVTVAVRPGLEISSEARQALLRILREAMSNATRHAEASKVHVAIDGPAPLVMAISDDGVGFDPETAGRPDSLGLQSMRERAINLGGYLSVESLRGQGTTVALVLP
jgi:signal transduction histidine kinase